MFLYLSNHLEALAEALGDVIQSRVYGPFDTETIVVQSQGMQKWLTAMLARRFGVWSNARFPFPRAFIESTLASVLDESPELAARYSRASLSWSIAETLPGLSRHTAFSEIESYLEGDDTGVKLVQISERIAHVFDQYLVYRPTQLSSWEASPQRDWQAVLWRTLAERLGPHHLAARAQRFFTTWSPLFARVKGLPQRISVIGINSLPPLYLRILSALAERIDVHLFVLSPSEQLWERLGHSERRRSRRWLRRTQSNVAPKHQLAASLGRTGAEFLQVLRELSACVQPRPDGFRTSNSASLLGALQDDLLRDTPGRHHAPPEYDGSISIHSCHSPLREVQVLRDQLLDAFQRNPTLEPHEVIVMMPKVETYAPFIDSVFGGDPEGTSSIPYRISDRSQRVLSPVAQAILSLIQIARGRMKASEVLDVVQLEPVRQRFGISADALPQLQTWVLEANIRWGEGAEDRVTQGLPGHDQNSFRSGLRRLFLGYALPGHGRLAFEGVVPYDDIEGEPANLLGSFAELCQSLFWLREELRAPRSVRAWCDTLGSVVERMLMVKEYDSWQVSRVLEQLAELSREVERAGFNQAVDLEAFRIVVRERFEAALGEHAFLTGGVTFCAMLPMRTIPFKVVCLLGMNDGEFPRVQKSPSFDLIAQEPWVGDRSTRDDDRYLFLEAVLSARERLIVTYVGRQIQDNSERPPSVVIGELLDSIERSFGEQVGLVVEHPLQPFNPSYFSSDSSSELFSYSELEASAARALSAPERRVQPLLVGALSENDGQRVVSLDALCAFLENPARSLILERSGVRLRERPRILEDRESIELDGLERYFVGQHLLEWALDGSDFDKAWSVTRAQGALPLGTPGICLFREIATEVAELARAARPFRTGELLTPLPFEVTLGKHSVAGVLRELYADARLVVQYAQIKPKNLVALWARHLVLCSLDAEPLPRESVLVGHSERAKQIRVSRLSTVPRAEARALLNELVELFWLGQTVGLPLFPSSAYAYAKARAQQATDDVALERARRQYVPGRDARRGGAAEAADPYFSRLFGLTDPLDPEFYPLRVTGAPKHRLVPSFGELARIVFDPLLRYTREVSS